jgi:hypothetical protein
MKNPFEVNTPEGISPEDVHELFVNVFSDFHQVPKIGHTFLNGPRGSGKSMMFRYMMPDCQVIEKNCKLSELDYFSLYVPIKLTDLNNQEIGKLKTNSGVFINEHLLTTFISIKCFKSLLNFIVELEPYREEFISFYRETFLWHMSIIGGNNEADTVLDSESIKVILNKIIFSLDKIYRECIIFCKRYLQQEEVYMGPLCSYLDFLYPILLELKKLSFFPQNKPLFILIDDAGYLSKVQTQILNTWVSYRTSSDISLKISTQLDYKSFSTINNKTIDSPHDYSQVNISTIYTAPQNNYHKRISDIVKKRLKRYLNIEIEPDSFFPLDMEQEELLNKIKKEIKLNEFNPEKDYVAGDAAKRYGTSELMKYLKKKRSASNYSYAGFDSLVDISSGIIRHFLEPASIMFSEYCLSLKIENIDSIPQEIQNNVIHNYSRRLLEDEFIKIHEIHGEKEPEEELSKADKLFNLINGMGELFHKIFVSNKTERGVFSVALNDVPDNELKEILDLAEQYGYIHKSSIGNKMGTGRTRLYVLSRTLAPYFKLDPSGFKGYQFMNSETLKVALKDKRKFVAHFKLEAEVAQFKLFNDNE